MEQTKHVAIRVSIKIEDRAEIINKSLLFMGK